MSWGDRYEELQEAKCRADAEKLLENRVPCILFFDSLKAHGITRVGNKVRKWLTSEWERLNTGDDFTFTEESLPIYSPTGKLQVPVAAFHSLYLVPYQTNGCDCGVFVCRYTYAMYKLRNADFTYASSGVVPGEKKSSAKSRSPFREQITENEAFKFDMNDIAKLREHLATLIERLHEQFVPWRQEEQKKRRLERKREAQMENDTSNRDNKLSAEPRPAVYDRQAAHIVHVPSSQSDVGTALDGSSIVPCPSSEYRLNPHDPSGSPAHYPWVGDSGRPREYESI